MSALVCPPPSGVFYLFPCMYPKVLLPLVTPACHVAGQVTCQDVTPGKCRSDLSPPIDIDVTLPLTCFPDVTPSLLTCHPPLQCSAMAVAVNSSSFHPGLAFRKRGGAKGEGSEDTQRRKLETYTFPKTLDLSQNLSFFTDVSSKFAHKIITFPKAMPVPLRPNNNITKSFTILGCSLFVLLNAQ